MNNRDKLYSNYVSTHTIHLYGEASIEGIKRQFPVWKRYYGRFLPENKNAKILDAGCGNGGFIYWLQEMGYVNASGIDISPEQIEVSKRFGVKVEQGDLVEWLKDNKETMNYDLIFARDVIEHFGKDDISKVAGIFHRALKKGGFLVLYTLNAESPFGCRLRYGDFTHEVGFTPSAISRLLHMTGFTDTEAREMGPVPFGYSMASTLRYLVWRTIRVALKVWNIAEMGGAGSGVFTRVFVISGIKK